MEIPHDGMASNDTVRFDKIGPGALLVGLIGVVASLVLMFSPGTQTHMLGSYVFGFIFWISVTLGFFGLSVLHHTVKGSWGLPLLRMFEAGGGARMFIVFAVLFIPVLANLFNHHGLYEWTHTEVVANDVLLQHKAPYLNVTGFIVRFVIYFALWAAIAAGMRASTRRQDESGAVREENRRTNYAAPGLVAFVLTVTFAFTDWVMSLEPHWFSTIYGVWFVVGQALAGLALATVLLCVNAHKKPFSDIMTPNLTRDLGNLLFVFTMLWAYTSLSQFLIIWNGNLPETTQYYVKRAAGGWNAIGLALIVGQFIVPFLALVAPRVKRTPERLAKVAGWIFFIRLIDIFYIVAPALPERPVGPIPLFTDAIALIGLGGVWFFVFAKEVAKAPLLVKYDQRLQEAKHHVH